MAETLLAEAAYVYSFRPYARRAARPQTGAHTLHATSGTGALGS